MIDWVKDVRAIEKPKGNPWKKDGQELQLIPSCQTHAGQASAKQMPSLLCNPQSPQIQWNSLFSPLSVTVTPITYASLGDPSV